MSQAPGTFQNDWAHIRYYSEYFVNQSKRREPRKTDETQKIEIVLTNLCLRVFLIVEFGRILNDRKSKKFEINNMDKEKIQRKKENQKHRHYLLCENTLPSQQCSIFSRSYGNKTMNVVSVLLLPFCCCFFAYMHLS